MWDKDELSRIYSRQAETVYRVCYMFVKNPHDAEDMTHNAFVKLMNGSSVAFENAEHEKAWLIRAAANICKDFLKSAWAKRTDIPETHPAPQKPENEALRQVLAMPDRYKIPIYLFYYEGYKTDEIAKMLGKPASTVRGLLHRGRKILKIEMEEKYNGKERADIGV
ncbi:MAG: sigma-70 family RNA polymerase sigma factor [Oscillospiraceae bacterium]|jgi:RNA polymerase sigma-70 factor (ECF subfamily)|nr:sigma-70 family RNA polymerase sigma factor [Oscillospiraceae bacterium]